MYLQIVILFIKSFYKVTLLFFKSISSSYDFAKLIDLPKIEDPLGNRFFINEKKITAPIQCHQFLNAVIESFEIELNDGKTTRTVLLNRPYYGLHIPLGIWAAEKGFSSGAICLVLASLKYDAIDYIRDYDDFMIFKNQLK